jgi:predicted RNA-binding protein (virulence factor B family)
MKVRDVTPVGAFLDWGIMKDLLVPFREQKKEMKAGRYYLVYIYLDFVTSRITASARIDKFLDNTPPDYEQNQEVDILVAGETEIGYKVIINNSHWGLLYHNEIFQRLSTGEKRKAYIKEVRDDEKIDVSIYPTGFGKAGGIADKIISALEQNNGYLPVNDKSDAAEIHTLFSCSKKSFKMAVGTLYKKRLISIDGDGIRTVTNKRER